MVKSEKSHHAEMRRMIDVFRRYTNASMKEFKGTNNALQTWLLRKFSELEVEIRRYKRKKQKQLADLNKVAHCPKQLTLDPRPLKKKKSDMLFINDMVKNKLHGRNISVRDVSLIGKMINIEVAYQSKLNEDEIKEKIKKNIRLRAGFRIIPSNEEKQEEKQEQKKNVSIEDLIVAVTDLDVDIGDSDLAQAVNIYLYQTKIKIKNTKKKQKKKKSCLNANLIYQKKRILDDEDKCNTIRPWINCLQQCCPEANHMQITDVLDLNRCILCLLNCLLPEMKCNDNEIKESPGLRCKAVRTQYLLDIMHALLQWWSCHDKRYDIKVDKVTIDDVLNNRVRGRGPSAWSSIRSCLSRDGVPVIDGVD